MIIRNLQQDIFIHDELKITFKTLEEKSYIFVQGYCFEYRDTTQYRLFFKGFQGLVMMKYYTWFPKILMQTKCSKPELELIPKEILEVYRGGKHGLPSYKRGFLVSKN